MKHGTITGYQYHKCRCDECKEAARDYKRQYKARLLTTLNAHPDDPRHGKLGSYQAGCRCDSCLAIGREHGRTYMAKWTRENPERQAAIAERHTEKALKELSEDPDDPRHGKEGTYTLGCRCGRCRDAHRTKNRERDARKREAEGREKGERRPDPRHAVVKEMWTDNAKRADIAEATGLTPGAITNIAKRLGLPPRRSRSGWAAPRDAKIAELYRADVPLADIATQAGLTYDGVRGAIRRLGLKDQ